MDSLLISDIAVPLLATIRRIWMNGKISKCGICGMMFETGKDLAKHKDKEHRITNQSFAQRMPVQ